MRNNKDSSYNKVSIDSYYKKALTRHVTFLKKFRCTSILSFGSETDKNATLKNQKQLPILKILEHTCLTTFDKIYIDLLQLFSLLSKIR